jgi:hypothetical protein
LCNDHFWTVDLVEDLSGGAKKRLEEGNEGSGRKALEATRVN